MIYYQRVNGFQSFSTFVEIYAFKPCRWSLIEHVFFVCEISRRGAARRRSALGAFFFHKSTYAIPDFGYRECRLIKSLSSLSSTPAVYNLVVARERKVYIAIRRDLCCPSTIDCSPLLSQDIYKKVYLLL